MHLFNVRDYPVARLNHNFSTMHLINRLKLKVFVTKSVEFHLMQFDRCQERRRKTAPLHRGKKVQVCEKLCTHTNIYIYIYVFMVAASFVCANTFA